ncbi:MAG: adenosylcobinamide-GDP ribazoletransferase [bacterium]|nr:adenosylcobinamide-GDP ribazoletransferase [bacterium]
MMIKAFILQIQFLTRIPLPVEVEFDDDIFARSFVFAPLIGLLIGAVLGGVYYLVGLTGKELITAIAVVTALVFMTGALHLDGLADAADGLFSNRPKERVLEIMKDSRIGTNGTVAIVLILILKIGLLVSLDKTNLFYYIIVMPVFSRMSIAWIAGISGYARDDKGMGSAIVEKTGLTTIILATLIALAAAVLFIGLMAAAAAFAVILFTVLLSRYSTKKIGGITGDIIGANIELSEVVFLISILVCEAAGISKIAIGGTWFI